MKTKLIAGMLMALPTVAAAQSAIDAYSISQSDLRGSARFMSMGGAFTALGGDISTLNQNPGGIGIYRSSDISATLDINFMGSTAETPGLSNKISKTRAACNNFGYIGAVRTGNETMPFFNWGVSYSRVASFDRRYAGAFESIGTSLTNLVANYTNTDLSSGLYTPNQMWETNNYNPYFDSQAPWTSILMYNGYGINTPSSGASSVNGLFKENATVGSGSFEVEEKGFVDEYAINLGGNILNTVYWGIGFGITDIDFKQYAYYSESFSNADISYGNGTTNGDASYGLNNYKRIYGSGFNFKAGLILKPINEFRFGIAVHTPTYYNLTYEGQGAMGYRYYSDLYADGKPSSGNVSTEVDDVDFKTRSPWRLMVGAAGVIGGKAIISADYEYRAYSDMKVQDWNGNDYFDINEDVKTYYQAVNVVRLGAEYRVTPSFSIRAGYAYESSPVKSELLDPTGNTATYVFTSGPDDTETQPAYTLDRSTQYITCGLGYRYKMFYADLAYVHRYRQSDYHAFSDYNDELGLVIAPSAKLTDHNNSLILTVGFKF
ncbi:MAG: hypothetical protein HFJ91_04830 [Muribaculaceae bacterium]|nr:hypothetical protein [Muribaculaceae bacterium]